MERVRPSSLGQKAPAGQKAGPWRGNFTMRQATQHPKRAMRKAFPCGAWLLRFPNPTATLSLSIEQVSLPSWTNLTTITGNGAIRSVTHTNASETQQFYRLRVA